MWDINRLVMIFAINLDISRVSIVNPCFMLSIFMFFSKYFFSLSMEYSDPGGQYQKTCFKRETIP